MNCKMEAKTDVNPTEDLEKVIGALSNIFDYDDLVISEDQVTVTGDISCLYPFKEFLEKTQIRDTARRMLLKGLDSATKRINLKLSKQAAYAGKINLVDDDLSPLGEIELVIETEDPEEFIGWLCDH
ncbi:RNA-binding domain-containing protein [Methanobacterium ferruginis]|uniref:RNA-binding domain-containing protein n=1 Tax=Methanobacterium ferruginis TaxID=710191 RepID=UPI002572C767|nr:RNA-binding domain-containing protein [Methanobacterium ferruginis]BDZ68441.1 hypothetical protein GCM10025860_18890 [Methanobacterium ferruginis]